MRILKILLAVLAVAFFVITRLNNSGTGPVQPPRAAPDTTCVLDHCNDTPAPVPAAPGPLANAVAPPAALPPAPAPTATNAGFGPLAPGNFDFYVLTLSWSPGFCETNPAGNGKAQCDSGSNLGFVVHGLWPQFERGYPSDCDQRQATQAALALARGVFPDQGLARYEWGKHGTCSGLPPEAYFADVKRARDAIAIPAAFNAPNGDQNFSPNDIMRSFTDANPRLRPGMLAVGCKGGVLEEVRFCLSKDLRSYQACPEVVQQSCRAGQLRVPAVR